jgi:hypothetical protein
MLNKGVYKTGILCTETTRDDVEKTLEAFEQSLSDLKPVIQEVAPHLLEN